jgi:iron complex transport system substrate-binding protein
VRLILALVLLGAAAVRADGFVSLNLCTDQLLLELLPREQVLMLSQLAADPHYSSQAGRAAGIPAFDGSAETILRLGPQRVLAGRYAARPVVNTLERLGIEVKMFEMPVTIAGTREFITAVAAAIGREASGRELVDRMDARLDAVASAASGPPMPTLLYLPNGLTTGANTLKHELLQLAGLRNLAAGAGIVGYGTLSLERIVRSRPRLLLFDSVERGGRSLAQRLQRHPALAGASAQRATIPTATWICPGPQIAAAAEALLAVRQAVD